MGPGDPRTHAVVSAVNAHWNGQIKPNWTTQPDRINDGWIEAGSARSEMLAGETNRVRVYVQAVERLKFRRTSDGLELEYPFDIGEAGWFLQILAELP
jgi:hypothetical protein